MVLIINGKKKEFKDDTTIQEILKELNILDKVMACAVNMQIVKQENWNQYTPKDGDKLELLDFVGGG
jgi:sulfur carrier protein